MQRDESLARSNEIDQICDEFEQACRAGTTRRIEDLLAENPGVDRTRLLRELLLIELEIRQQQGESASVNDYAARFPNDTDIVDAAVETILLKHDPDVIEETVDVVQNADDEETYVPGDGAEQQTVVPDASTSPDLPESGGPGGRQFGDYELLHEIARGGMGVVYKARQTKLNRIVALKMIKAGELAGDEEVKRFHAEAEAAAALDHPGIVPIYEVGEWRAGGVSPPVHFFSMGFVDGQGLDARVKESPLPPKDAAELIRTIAEAVQYAHDKGIVHRDLKPANVLLANDGADTSSATTRNTSDATSRARQEAGTAHPLPDGRGSLSRESSLDDATAIERHNTSARAGTARHYVPKITDFGLAKNIAADSGMTATGQVMGTPSYMPPEQAAGKINEIGPLADVYSLGAMLYATLTGRPPFQAANVMETLKQVLEREPVSPSQLNPAVDKDLETICLKCLEKDPAKRYATARDLAGDLECYLAGKPISARPISRPARLWRWCKRNPLGATVAGLLLFLAIAGPTVAAIQIDTNRRLDAALTGEKEATATAQKKEQETAAALTQVKVALANEQAALKRKDKALLETEKSIDAYVAVVKNAELLKDPRFKPLLKDLLKDALAHYTRFIEEHKHEQSLAMRYRIGQSLKEVGLINSQSGSTEGAVAATQKALSVFRQLAIDDRSVSMYRSDLGSTFNTIGVLHSQTGKYSESLAAYNSALAVFNSLARDHATNTKYQRSLASTYNNIGTLHTATLKFGEALAAYGQAAKIWAKLNHRYPSTPRFQYGLAVTRDNIGAAYMNLRKPSEALLEFQQALHISEKLARDNSNEKYRSCLAGSYSKVGALYQVTGKPTDAIASYKKATAILQELSREYPMVARFQSSLATSYSNTGSAFHKVGKHLEAMRAFKNAIVIEEKLALENPTSTSCQMAVAASYYNLGKLYSDTSNVEKASAAYERVLSIWDKMNHDHQNIRQYAYVLLSKYDSIGQFYQKTGKPADALVLYERKIAIRKRLARETPAGGKLWLNLARDQNAIAILYKSIGKPTNALRHLNQAMQIYTSLLERAPQKGSARLSVRNTRLNRALVFDDLGRHDEAASDWRAALQLDDGTMRFVIMRFLTFSLSRAGNHVEASKLADRVAAGARNPATIYDLSRVYSISSAAAARDVALKTSERIRMSTQYAEKAMVLLKRSAANASFVESGGQELLATDPDFNSLRHRDDFRAFAKSVGVHLPAWARKPASATTGTPHTGALLRKQSP